MSGWNAAAMGLQVWGDIENRRAQERINRRNEALQREFAQNGVRWRVADARAAGIHPLAALGMSPTQAQPTAVSGDPGNAATNLGRNMQDAILQERIANSQLNQAYANQANANAERARAQTALDAIGPEGSPQRPKPLYTYFYDPYKGEVVPIMNEEAAGGIEDLAPGAVTLRGILNDMDRQTATDNPVRRGRNRSSARTRPFVRSPDPVGTPVTGRRGRNRRR